MASEEKGSTEKPSYKLIYFNYTGRAEPIRMLLRYGGLEFEEVRFKNQEWEEKYKQSMPYRQAPKLEITEGGETKVVHQSKAIARYLARQSGLVGSSDWDNLEIDMMVDTVYDLREKLATWAFLELNAERKKDLHKNLMELIPFYWKKFDDRVKANGGFFGIPDKFTWADIYLVNHMEETVNLFDMDTNFESYPNMQKLMKFVISQDRIAEWIRERPQCSLFSWDLRDQM